MPRARHSSTKPNRSTFPPPDFAFMRRTPRAAGPTGVPGAGLGGQCAPVAPKCVADEDRGCGEQREHDEQHHAVALAGEHHDDGEREETEGGNGRSHSSRPLARGRDPGGTGHPQEQDGGGDQSTQVPLEASERHREGSGDEHESTDRRRPASGFKGIGRHRGAAGSRAGRTRTR